MQFNKLYNALKSEELKIWRVDNKLIFNLVCILSLFILLFIKNKFNFLFNITN